MSVDTPMKPSLLIYLILLAATICVTSSVSEAAVVLYQHSGSTDPTTESWNVGGGDVNTFAGPIVNDSGSGLDAWFVNDLSTANGLSYFAPEPPGMRISTWRFFAFPK